MSKGSTNGSQSTGFMSPLVVNEMKLTVHDMYDMPKLMAQSSDPNRVYELVLKPTVKLYYHDQRVTHMELPPRVVPFGPHDIQCRSDRYQVDFVALAKTRSARASSQRVSATTTTTTSTTGAAGGSSTRNSISDGHMTSGAVDGSAGDLPINEMLIQYPSRRDLKSIIEIAVGVRERHAHATSVRWLTTSLEPGSSKQSDIANFAAAEGEVARHKIVMRFVGLVVGHLSCTLSLPYATADLTHVRVPADHDMVPQAYTDGLLMSALDRLEADQRRLHFLYQTNVPAQFLSRAQLEAALKRGESEWSLYRSMLLECDPDYFLKRVQSIIDMYPPTPQHLPWVQRPAEDLVAQHPDDELQLIRNLCADLGPELNSISPRTRRLVFSWFYHSPPREDLADCVRERYGDKINLDDFLDDEPDLYMAALCAKYGNELTPTRYYFPMIEYTEDSRRSFRSVLGRCTAAAVERRVNTLARGGASGGANSSVNRTSGGGGDEFGPSAALPQYLLQLTPGERPLRLPGSSSATAGNEIDILSNKYAEQFQFLTEPIAAAITEVIGDSVPSASALQALPPEFKVFESSVAQSVAVTKDMVNRCSGYTYISPSTLVATLIFLDRLCLRYPKLTLTAYNIRHLFITMARIASKVVDLRSINNKNFARVFDVRLSDFNVMEDHLLKIMQFDFMLTPEEFNDYADIIRGSASTAAAGAATTGSGGAQQRAPERLPTTLDVEASPVRAESVSLTSRPLGGRRTSGTSSVNGLTAPSIASSSLGISRPPNEQVARSYDYATARRDAHSTSSARPTHSESAHFQPSQNLMMRSTE